MTIQPIPNPPTRLIHPTYEWVREVINLFNRTHKIPPSDLAHSLRASLLEKVFILKTESNLCLAGDILPSTFGYLHMTASDLFHFEGISDTEGRSLLTHPLYSKSVGSAPLKKSVHLRNLALKQAQEQIKPSYLKNHLLKRDHSEIISLYVNRGVFLELFDLTIENMANQVIDEPSTFESLWQVSHLKKPTPKEIFLPIFDSVS